jgi:hypothetical protein
MRELPDQRRDMDSNRVAVTASSIAASKKAKRDPAVAIMCFEDEIPAFVEPAMNRLYGSLFSSMARFRVYGGAEHASTYVARRDQDIVALFLFRREGRHVRVLNEGMRIDDAAATCFADYIFDRFPAVDMISFNAVEGKLTRLPFPYQQYDCTEDSVVTLPDTPEAYLNNFGKSARRNIKYYLNRLKREFPSFDYRVHDGREVDEQFIRGIVRFNRLRFASTNRVSAITPEEEDRIVRMVRDCGMIGAATIDGKLVAGSITYRFGDHYYSWLKAHDPAYDDYRFGMIVSYLMICECIRRSGKTFHFLWGRQPQKALLQGEHRDQSRLTIYRSVFAVLWHADVALGNIYRDRARQAKLRLLALEKEDGGMPRAMHATLGGLRRVKGLVKRHD